MDNLDLEVFEAGLAFLGAGLAFLGAGLAAVLGAGLTTGLAFLGAGLDFTGPRFLVPPPFTGAAFKFDTPVGALFAELEPKKV